MLFRINTRALLIGGMLICALAGFGAPYVLSDVRVAFGVGWAAFGLLLLACRERGEA